MSQKRVKKNRKEILMEILPKIEIPSFGLFFKKYYWAFLLVLLGVVLVYANAMWGDFVSDDYATVPNNPLVTDFNFQVLSKENFFNSMSISNFVLANIFGVKSPIPYHIYSLLTYLISLFLTFWFLHLITKNEKITLLTILIYAFLPIHVEAVSWNAGRNYIITANYVLLTLIAFLYLLKTGNKKYLYLSLIPFILGFLTDKPRIFSVILIIPGILFFYRWNVIPKIIQKIIKLSPLIILLFIAASYSHIKYRIDVVNSGTNSSGSIFYSPFFQYPIAIPKYLQLMWAPADLTLYHTMYVLPAWLNWLTLLIFLTLVVYFWFRDKLWFFSLYLIIAALLPSMSPVKVSWLVAERYAYLGSLGWCLFLSLIILDLLKRLRLIPWVFLSLILIFYGYRIYIRNIDWRTNHNLWVNTCQVSPNSHNAWNNIGDDYDKLSQYENAVKGFTQSTLVKPNYADAYHNRANIFYKVGRLDLARESYNMALNFNPGLMQTYLSLTQIDINERKLDLALGHALKANEIEPSNPQTQFLVAVVYAEMGKIAESRNILLEILKSYPNYQLAKDALLKIDQIK